MHIEICLSSRVLGLSSISSTVAAFAADGGNLYWFYRLSCPWPSLFDTPGLPLVLCILSVRQFMSFVCHFWRSLSLANTHQTHAHTHTRTSAQSRRAAHPSDVSSVTVVVFLGFLCPSVPSSPTPAVCLNGNCLPGRCWVLLPRQLFFSLLGDPSYPPWLPLLNHCILSSTCSVESFLKPQFVNLLNLRPGEGLPSLSPSFPLSAIESSGA